MSNGRGGSSSFTASGILQRWRGEGGRIFVLSSIRASCVGFDTEPARATLLFLYKQVLGIELPWLDEAVPAKASRRLPMVLTQTEVRPLLNVTSGTMGIIISLLYGTGMRLLEGLRLRVKGIEFTRREIIAWEGNGNKDRVTVLPENMILPLRAHL
jgi:site-specific recombinase XerD